MHYKVIIIDNLNFFKIYINFYLFIGFYRVCCCIYKFLLITQTFLKKNIYMLGDLCDYFQNKLLPIELLHISQNQDSLLIIVTTVKLKEPCVVIWNSSSIQNLPALHVCNS